MEKNRDYLAEEFAVSVVRRLREAGHEALWAGGCVRDRLLGKQPKDYDVATNATPDQVCAVFGARRTLRIGEAFGVVAVLGKKPLEPIEVATFREEAGYSDGRHPDQVSFSNAEEDAKRRDFTINGMFYDPIQDRVIDYVQGQADLQAGTIRCIGNPLDRFEEDRLRMLRAIRFAATFDFRIDPETLLAIQKNAQHISVVSAERISNEMRRMMSHRNICEAMALLQSTGLRAYVMPEFDDSDSNVAAVGRLWAVALPAWDVGIRTVRRLHDISFEVTCAAMLGGLADPKEAAKSLARRWKLANSERELIVSLVAQESTIRRGDQCDWPRLQRILIKPFAAKAIEVAAAVAKTRGESLSGVEFCREKMSLPVKTLNPDPLIDGSDLISAGIQPGPAFRMILDTVRDQQLNGKLLTAGDALDYALRMSREET